MLLAGDEFGRTQNGNNNAWCQDNEKSWIDWSLLEKNPDLHRFFKNCIHLRKKYKIFRLERFFSPLREKGASHSNSTIRWQYLEPGTQNWDDDCHGLAFHLHDEEEEETIDFFLMINNSSETLGFTPPKPSGKRRAWFPLIDTSKEPPDDFSNNLQASPLPANLTITTTPFSCIVLQSN